MSEPLAGFTVAVTAARRREELVDLLERRGARVVEAPAIRIIPTVDDALLQKATQACLDDPPDISVITTGIGFRGWMEAADGWGLGDELRACLAQTQIMVRGPKAKGAVRSNGLAEQWSPDSESSEEVLQRLLAQGVTGKRIVIQLHGEPLTGVCNALREAGAEVLELSVYRWQPADDMRPVCRLIDQIIGLGVDCVTFTSALAVQSLLRTAAQQDRSAAMLQALRTQVLVATVGPITAAPLVELGVPVVQPDRYRLGALVRTVVEELPQRRSRSVHAGAHVLELRGHTVVVDGQPVELTGRQIGVMGALIDSRGNVVSRADLLRSAWPLESRDEHAVEMTVARLRTALGPAGKVIQTVVKRGYRLADPVS